MDLAYQSTESAWSQEKIYHNGDEYYDDVCRAILTADHSIVLESYIFEMDKIGRRIAECLKKASAKGISVRVLVDGFGSHFWINDLLRNFRNSQVEFKVYHQLYLFSRSLNVITRFGAGWKQLVSLLNRRTHRKLIVIDETIAFIGSRNISAVHSPKVAGINAWRDVSMRIDGGSPPRDLLLAFNSVWNITPPKRRWRSFFSSPHHLESPLVKLNMSRKLRRKNAEELRDRLQNAKERIWVVGSYFVPPLYLIKILSNVAKNGVDVKILVPSRSDVFFIPYIIVSFYTLLLKGNVQIFEYLPSVLHSKVVIIDDWVRIGSSNFNHRSMFHDLEADIIIESPQIKESIVNQFNQDCRRSKEVKKSAMEKPPLTVRLLSLLFSLLSYWS